MKIPVRRRKGESGQALILVLVALSMFLIAAVGLGIDGSHLYAQKQMAQAAADAAAQAGIMSIYDGTNTSGTHSFSTTSGVHTCSTSDPTPCYYAQTLNGFSSSNDTVTYEPNPSGLGITGLSASYAVNLLRVTVTRSVGTTLMQLLGPTASTVSASGTAAILTTLSPVPIVVLHPTLSGAFSKNGSNDVIICGGPSESIQVNSTSSSSVSVSGSSGTINLNHAGPLDAGNCVAGTGGSFGNVGNQTATPTGLLLGSLPGKYTSSASPMNDPLLGVPAPPSSITSMTASSVGTAASATGGTAAANSLGCPSTLPSSVTCYLFSPGYYPNGINLGGSSKAFALFNPGIYYIVHGGFQLNSNSIARTVTSATGDTITGTGWTQGMLIYNSPTSPVNASNDILSISSNSGQINNITYPDATVCGTDSSGNALGGNCLVGANGGVLTSTSCSSTSALNASYYGMLFFQNRSVATSLSHSISGGGGLTLKGTIYAAHTSSFSDGTYQSFTLQGNSGSTTTLQGEIIVDTLSLGGGANIGMNLSGLACYQLNKVALVQ